MSLHAKGLGRCGTERWTINKSFRKNNPSSSGIGEIMTNCTFQVLQASTFFFQSSVSNIGVAEPQRNLTAHILFPVSVILKTGDFAGEE